MGTLNNFFFIVLPYLALIVFIIGIVYRYREAKFKFSALSSQFLEGRKLFWGSVPFHWGIIIIFFGHLIAFLIPNTVLLWNGSPVRLVILEVAAFIFGLSAFIGLLSLVYRRLTNSRIRVVTNYMDIIVEIVFLAEIFLGLWIAYGFRWGSSWFSIVLTPYLRSLFELNPQIDAVVAMPLVIQLHIILAFIIVLLIPFSRLVHMFVFPLDYLWRPYQQVMWYWKKKKVRDPNSPWRITKPKNN